MFYIEKVIFTFQKEVADRIISNPNSKKYCRLSVITQAICNVEKKLSIPAKVFYPTPKVNSEVLVFSKREDSILEDFDSLKMLTKMAFNKRRKKIKNSLKNLNNIDEYLKKLNINENIRAEQISVNKYCALANLINSSN